MCEIIEEDRADDAQSVEDYFLSQRTIFFTGDFTEKSVDRAAMQLHYLAETNSSEDINIRVSSYGGDFFEFLRIYDIIQCLPCKVNVLAEGKVMSAGFGLLMCATGVRRAYPSTQFLMHNMSAVSFGRMDAIHDDYKHSKYLENVWHKLHVKHTKMTAQQVKDFMARETYMTANTAKKYGVIDSVVRARPRKAKKGIKRKPKKGTKANSKK